MGRDYEKHQSSLVFHYLSGSDIVDGVEYRITYILLIQSYFSACSVGTST